MKKELKDVTATRKDLEIEIPSEVVDKAVTRVTAAYGRRARVPGFRPGKVPAAVIRSRFRDQILQDVAQDLIPKAVAESLEELDQQPLDTPTIRDVSVTEGEPLSFRASFEILPAIDPGDYSSITLRRPPATVEPNALETALEQLRTNAARFEPVDDRASQTGDVLTADVTRTPVGSSNDDAKPSSHENVAIEIGSSSNPPGLDDHLIGLHPDANAQFTLTYPDDYEHEDLAGQSVAFDVTVKAVRLKVLPDLDDEFAKDVGDFESLEQLKERVESDLEQRAEQERDRGVRADLLKQLAARISAEIPDVLIGREIDRRVEEFVRRLVGQRVDPTRANIDWEQFRESQRESSAEAVRSTLALDEVARRESLEVSPEDVEREIAQHAEGLGRTPAAVRAQLEKDDGLDRVREGMLREKAIDFLLARATLVEA